MSVDPKSSKGGIGVRYSRVLGLLPAIAVGLSVMLSLGVFVLLGVTLDVARKSSVYALFVVVFLPVALTYAERAIASPEGRGGIYLGRSSDPNWYPYAVDWLAFGGFASLIAMLGWGVGLYVNLLLGRLFLISVDETYLALAAIFLMSWSSALGQHGTWRTRTRLVYLSLVVSLAVIGWGWFAKTEFVSPRFALPMPGNTVYAVAILGSVLWGLILIVDHRDRVRRPERTLLLSIVGATLIVSVAGWLAALVLLKYPTLLVGDLVPLASLTAASGGLLEVIYLVAGIVICIVGLDRALVSGRRMLGSMFEEGYFPTRFTSLNLVSVLMLRPLFLLVPVSLLVVAILAFTDLVRLSALLFFATTVLVNGRQVFRALARTQRKTSFRLPFHPLFPALAVVVCLYFAFALAFPIWLMGLVWAVIGGLYYLAYARKGGLTTRRREHVLAEELPSGREKTYRVLVEVVGIDALASLLQASARLAQTRQGRVLVMQVLVEQEETPAAVQRETAQAALRKLKEQVLRYEIGNVPVETMVRLSSSRAAGILETAQEERIDLILLGWERVSISGESSLEENLNRIVRAAPCDVAILRGGWTESVSDITVATAGGPHAAKALELGQQLAEVEGGQVEALYVIPGALTAEKEAQARTRLGQAITSRESSKAIQTRIAPVRDIKSGILNETAGASLLLLGASHQGFTDQDVFDGIPLEVAGARSGSTLLVKHFEGTGQFALRRIWDRLYDPFPKLTVSERLAVNQNMSQSALGSVDFYALILLASVIAVLGMMQNSTGVIIGAMLVAPLMSPILAMSHSIVLGDMRTLTRAGESTIKGIVLAISVAIAVSLIIPEQPITQEIVSRTQPNLLDLMVALASGAAAAYTLSRKHLAAALPGVAIAVSLVPPLVVVGFGLGYGLYSVAGGALLLFLTNLTAIILAAAIVFLLLGFRPVQAERGRAFRRGILLSMVTIIIIAAPLGYETFNFQRQRERQRIVESALSDSIQAEFADIEDLAIQPKGDGFVVSGTIYAYEDVTDVEIAEIQERLSEAIGAHVSIRARVIQASLEIVE